MPFKPHVTHSEKADAVYVYVSNATVARTHRLSDLRMVDYAADGSVVGIEFLGVSRGVDLSDVPDRERVEQLLKTLSIDALAQGRAPLG